MHQAVFDSLGGREKAQLWLLEQTRELLATKSAWRGCTTWFRRYRKMAGIKKKVTAHIMRHTVATTLLFNGCPIGHIKEILGHELLQTTCKFYLGTDKRAAKGAHAKYLNYDQVRNSE